VLAGLAGLPKGTTVRTHAVAPVDAATVEHTSLVEQLGPAQPVAAAVPPPVEAAIVSAPVPAVARPKKSRAARLRTELARYERINAKTPYKERGQKALQLLREQAAAATAAEAAATA
jgi:hypothetical protein